MDIAIHMQWEIYQQGPPGPGGGGGPGGMQMFIYLFFTSNGYSHTYAVGNLPTGTARAGRRRRSGRAGRRWMRMGMRMPMRRAVGAGRRRRSGWTGRRRRATGAGRRRRSRWAGRRRAGGRRAARIH